MTATPLPAAPRITSQSGFLKPVFSALQRRALRTGIGFGAVFSIGLGAICWQLYRLIPAGARVELFAVNGVSGSQGSSILPLNLPPERVSVRFS